MGALRQALAGPMLQPQNPSSATAAQPAALLSNKACFGHTEGAAGLSGLLLAAAAACAQSAAPVRHLRVTNPYVAAALGDWARQGGRGPHVPRQVGAGGWALGGALGRLAGTSSFGMSGVNAHALVGPGLHMQPPLHAQVRVRGEGVIMKTAVFVYGNPDQNQSAEMDLTRLGKVRSISHALTPI